jgi:hypothetical protein
LTTTLHHEFAHLFGFSTFYRRFSSRLQPSEEYPSHRSFTGSTVTALVTPTYEGTHLSERLYPFDLLTPYQSHSQRRVPSGLSRAILGDAFGYTFSDSGPQPVPEPATLSLIGAALLAAAAVRRNRHAAAATPTLPDAS